MKNVLIISASDSIAGAGMQTDLKACTLLGVYATTCLTAITAQNTGEVREVFALPASLICSQIDCIMEDLCPDAVKIGLLGSRDVVDAVSQAISHYKLHNVVLDPVLVATCGDGLLADDGGAISYAQYLSDKLFGQVSLITPNVREATELSGMDARSNPEEAGKALCNKYGCNVLLKGGDACGIDSVDLLFAMQNAECTIHRFASSRVDTHNTHGTGCTLSSAIAAKLALGQSMNAAITEAKSFVHEWLVKGQHTTFGTHGYGPTILSKDGI